MSYQHRRKAENRFFKLLNKHFTCEKISKIMLSEKYRSTPAQVFKIQKKSNKTNRKEERKNHTNGCGAVYRGTYRRKGSATQKIEIDKRSVKNPITKVARTQVNNGTCIVAFQ